jgi:hypothetical protein
MGGDGHTRLGYCHLLAGEDASQHVGQSLSRLWSPRVQDPHLFQSTQFAHPVHETTQGGR